MAASATLLQFLLIVVAGWLHRQQAAVIEYLNAENRLRERLGGRRIIFTDGERRNLAEKAKAVGRKTLRELGTIVTPETLFRWHRELVARKWTFIERRRPGRPRTGEELAMLVGRMATENPGWGYTRIGREMRIPPHHLRAGLLFTDNRYTITGK